MQRKRCGLVSREGFQTVWASGGRSMISDPTDDEKYLIFRALVRTIKTNSGDGFLNSDQGHPAYVLGAQDKVDAVMGGDSPEKNTLFKLLESFDQTYHGVVPNPDLSTWQKFCAFAVDANNRERNPGGG